MSSEAAAAPITPVILCGGAGTRLWPLSRIDRLKPMVDLTGGGTLLQLTARRTADPAAYAAPVLVAGADEAETVVAQLDAVGAVPSLVILEPCPRGTAAAIALAALALDGGDLMLVMPSDHVIADVDAFRAAVAAARPLAEDGRLVMFGIAPDRPETGYGYIKRGAPLGPGFAVARFAEKPDRETAERYLAEGGHDWNAGIFLMRADALLAALAQHAPAILESARAATAAQARDGSCVMPAADALARAPADSIDRAVMEKSDRVAVMPVAMGWSDVGSWEAVHALGPHDEAGNAVSGDAIALDSKGCLVRSDGPVVVALGVEDLVIVATERAVLVVPKGQTQRVKEAIDALAARKERRGG